MHPSVVRFEHNSLISDPTVHAGARRLHTCQETPDRVEGQGVLVCGALGQHFLQGTVTLTRNPFPPDSELVGAEDKVVARTIAMPASQNPVPKRIRVVEATDMFDDAGRCHVR